MASMDLVDYLSKHKNNLLCSTTIDGDGWIGLFHLADNYYITLFFKNVFEFQWDFSNANTAITALYDYIQIGKIP